MSRSNHYSAGPTDAQSDRRRSDRMAIEQEVQYRVLDKKDGQTIAQGKTVNISSSGVLFTTQEHLVAGRQVELDISWPAQINSKCGLKLIARGRVVRMDGDRAALAIMQHEFRTKSTRPLATQPK
jgi:hypothetical protein